MAKIKCPHCGATNQDVTTNDSCWQCGTALGAPVSAPDTESGPSANADRPPAAPILTTVQTTRPEPAPSPAKQPVAEPRPNRQMVVTLAVALLVILLLIMFYLTHRH